MYPAEKARPSIRSCYRNDRSWKSLLLIPKENGKTFGSEDWFFKFFPINYLTPSVNQLVETIFGPWQVLSRTRLYIIQRARISVFKDARARAVHWRTGVSAARIGFHTDSAYSYSSVREAQRRFGMVNLRHPTVTSRVSVRRVIPSNRFLDAVNLPDRNTI